MNAKTVHELRAILNAYPSIEDNPAVRANLWRKMKRAYLRLNKHERHPDRLPTTLPRSLAEIASTQAEP